MKSIINFMLAKVVKHFYSAIELIIIIFNRNCRFSSKYIYPILLCYVWWINFSCRSRIKCYKFCYIIIGYYFNMFVNIVINFNISVIYFKTWIFTVPISVIVVIRSKNTKFPLSITNASHIFMSIKRAVS